MKKNKNIGLNNFFSPFFFIQGTRVYKLVAIHVAVESKCINNRHYMSLHTKNNDGECRKTQQHQDEMYLYIYINIVSQLQRKVTSHQVKVAKMHFYPEYVLPLYKPGAVPAPITVNSEKQSL